MEATAIAYPDMLWGGAQPVFAATLAVLLEVPGPVEASHRGVPQIVHLVVSHGPIKPKTLQITARELRQQIRAAK